MEKEVHPGVLLRRSWPGRGVPEFWVLEPAVAPRVRECLQADLRNVWAEGTRGPGTRAPREAVGIGVRMTQQGDSCGPHIPQPPLAPELAVPSRRRGAGLLGGPGSRPGLAGRGHSMGPFRLSSDSPPPPQPAAGHG